MASVDMKHLLLSGTSHFEMYVYCFHGYSIYDDQIFVVVFFDNRLMLTDEKFVELNDAAGGSTKVWFI